MRVQPGQVLLVQFHTGTTWVLVAVVRLVGKDLVVTVLLTVVVAVEETAERKADNMKRETSAFLPRCLAGELINSSSRALVTAT
ncbi:hypothetical protein D3C76_1273360 [compost metagenome]